MKNKFIVSSASIATGAAIALSCAFPVFAESVPELKLNANLNVHASTTASTTKITVEARKLEQTKTRGTQEIDRRIEKLNKLVAAISGMKRVNDAQKVSLKASVQTQIDALIALKAKITAETNLDMIKTEVKSITDSYRIFALVMPQTEIIAAADKIITTADAMAALSTKISAQASASSTPSLTEYNTKIVAAKADAQTAITAVLALKPDMGNKDTMKSNEQVLKDARAKIKSANDSLKSARKSLDGVVNTPKAKVKVDVRASTTLEKKLR